MRTPTRGPEWVRVSQLRDVVGVFSPPDPAPVLAAVKTSDLLTVLGMLLG
jgi:hypothetical protein